MAGVKGPGALPLHPAKGQSPPLAFQPAQRAARNLCQLRPLETRSVWVGGTITIVLAAIYFFAPLVITGAFSLWEGGSRYGFAAYRNLIGDHEMWASLLLSLQLAVETIALGMVLLLPAMIFVHLRAPRLRTLFEFISALPFVVPAIALVAGLTTLYTGPDWLIGTPNYLVIPYFFLALPYGYRALDVGLASLDLRTLTEAGQSLGASWPQLLLRRRAAEPDLGAARRDAAYARDRHGRIHLRQHPAVQDLRRVHHRDRPERRHRSGGAHAAELRDHLGCHARRARDRPRPRGAGGRRTLMARVALEGIGKSFGAALVLRDVSLAMGEGELVSLLGPSGCGKTTLLRILAGFERPDAGRVMVDGEDLGELAPNRRAMGMVFQAYSLFPNMTARQNVAFGLRVRGTARGEQARRAATLLDLVGLSAHAEKYPRQLSGGQQQRVALARALAIEPRVLLLDEPLSALDAQVRVQLREEIRRVQVRTGVTTVFVTHDQEEALSISDRVAVMHEGRIRQLDTPSRIYREPADGFVAGFVGAASVFAGTVAGRAVALRRHRTARRGGVGAGRGRRGRAVRAARARARQPRPPSRARSRARSRS